MAKKGQPPSFQHYAGDWIAETQGLTAAARGVLINLRSHVWLRGDVPADEAELARLGGVTRGELRRLWPRLAGWFVPGATPGTLVDPVIVLQRQELSVYRDQQRKNAKSRWGADTTASGSHMPPASSSPSLSSSPSSPPDLSLVSGAPGSPLISRAKVLELWQARTGSGPFVQGLELVQERVEHYARTKAGGRSPEEITRAAIDAFVQIADGFAPGFRPQKTGYKFADHWARIEPVLDGAPIELPAQKASAGPTIVSGLDFSKKERP